jgi:GNAT superfamily N-acetyltransferase
LWFSETHVWYELPLDPATSGGTLPLDAEMIRLHRGDVALLEACPVGLADFEEARLRAGLGDLSLVVRGGVRLFHCWTYEERTPVAAAPSGTLAVPAGVMVIEDVETAAAYRGRGIAPAALLRVTADMAGRGSTTALAKVERGNHPSHRAFTKAGFRPVAVMDRQKRGPFAAVDVLPLAETRTADVLRHRLGSGEHSRGRRSRGRVPERGVGRGGAVTRSRVGAALMHRV